MWRPDILPTTLVLEPAVPGLGPSRPFDALPEDRIRADQLLSDGRHLVVGHDGLFHRLWILDPTPGRQLAYVVIRDHLALRCAAIERFEDWLAGRAPPRSAADMVPSAFQHARLRLLLSILDAIEPASGPAPTTYDLARTVIYPRMTLRRGAEWKSSSERRRTQRLLAEAHAMSHVGYRALLSGTTGGATKAPWPK